MSSIMELTDKQWYNFICGMQAGLRLKDMTLPAYDTNVVLTPIGVGGYGQIGIAIPQILYDGVTNTGLIPVYTHDVDIDYSAFSCNITWDSSRLQVLDIVDGDFGEVGTAIQYTMSTGQVKVLGMRDHTVVFNKPIILFYLLVLIINTNITKDNPILINLLSGSGSDQNFTTLLKYIQNEIDNQYYLYYITPIKNISGGIVSEKETNRAPVGDDKVIAAPSSPSGIYIGQAFTKPGTTGIVPIVANSNIDDLFPYSGIHTTVVVEDTSMVFSYINVVGVYGWTLSVTQSTNSEGKLVLDIYGERDIEVIDSGTVGYIEYLTSNLYDSYWIPLNNTVSELINNEETRLVCERRSGAISYYLGENPPDQGGSDETGSGGPPPGGGGGCSGGGTIWSDSEQVIWISVNNAPKYPVLLHPGNNDVKFWIPFIFPDDEWIEAPLIIEAPGYILIPAGFEFGVKKGKNAPEQFPNTKLIDKLKFIDVYDYDIQSIPVPVNLDGIFDEIVFEDTHSIDIVAISNIVDKYCIEELNMQDINDYDIQGAPFSGEVNQVDEIKFNDITKTELINTSIINSNNIEDISFTDINAQTVKSVTVDNQSEEENLGFDDFVQIEK